MVTKDLHDIDSRLELLHTVGIQAIGTIEPAMLRLMMNEYYEDIQFVL